MDGITTARVTSVQDPEGLGRVRIAVPALEGSSRPREVWARLATMMAGPNRGTWFLPDVNDEVLVAFEAGDPRQPYVIGALWNARHAPPAQMDPAGQNALKVMKSRSGLTLTFDDTKSAARMVLATSSGESVTIAEGADGIELTDTHGNSIRIQPSGITIAAAARVTVQAAHVKISAGAIELDSGMTKCAGTLQATTVIASSVVSSSYSPGAGNLW